MVRYHPGLNLKSKKDCLSIDVGGRICTFESVEDLEMIEVAFAELVQTKRLDDRRFHLPGVRRRNEVEGGGDLELQDPHPQVGLRLMRRPSTVSTSTARGVGLLVSRTVTRTRSTSTTTIVVRRSRSAPRLSIQ
jgi:hypothetical protein